MFVVESLEFRVDVSGLGVLGFGFWVKGFRFRV